MGGGVYGNLTDGKSHMGQTNSREEVHTTHSTSYWAEWKAGMLFNDLGRLPKCTNNQSHNSWMKPIKNNNPSLTDNKNYASESRRRFG